MTDARKKRKLTGNVQFKFVVSFFVIIAALLVLLNTYPMMTSRDLVFAEKQSSLMSRASVISASLSALDTFTESTVTQVMDLLDISGLSRIVVTDESGRILYDTAQERQTGKFALFSEIARALDGECVFWSRFAEGAFLSRAAIPIRSRAVSVGAVYLC